MTPTIDEICDQFETDRATSVSKPIASYLESVKETHREELLCQLLQIEVEAKLTAGEPLSERDYHAKYDRYPRAVANAFKAVEKRMPEIYKRQAVKMAKLQMSDSKTNAAIGDHSTSDSTNASTSEPSKVVLRVTEGPSQGKEMAFTDHQTCVVGRSREAHLRLSPNREFSRFHCRLEINPPEVSVVDLGSTNGTKVNGKKIEATVLSCGDVVTVGDTTFEVRIQQQTTVGSNKVQPTILGHALPVDDGMDSFDEPVPQISGYVIERQVGHGSMGIVYFARRIATNEKVAIKIVRPIVATDRKAVEKFRREAAIVLRLQHKRIVKSLDFRLTPDMLPYLVMEYIEEVNLREILDGASLEDRCRMAAGIMARALEGLQYAHDMEIVHRDVKPSNLLVYRSGRKLQVKLADFGLAKNFIDAGFSDCSTSNEICGTLAYMPPEQIIDCRHSKPSCDIYAAGVCLYNMISGRLPFEAEMVAQQISLILNTTPKDITEHVPTLPNGLAAIIQKSVARDIAQRYSTAAEMRRDLLPYTKRRTH